MKTMIEIIDNRNGKQDLEIDLEGYGKWYAWNTESDKIVPCKFKWQAQEIKNNPECWDI
jgi:hypothetical protein